jgi:hypothetical protein
MPRPLRTALCTLNRIIQRLNASSSDINVSTVAAQTTQINTESANFQAEMADCIYKASDLIASRMNAVFVPYQHTQTWRGKSYRRDWQRDPLTGDSILRLPDRLLSVTSLTLTGTALASDDYYLRPEDNAPYREIAIYSDSTITLPSASTETIALVGIWGHHPQPTLMWKDSGANVADNPSFSAAATTFTASSSTALEVLQYIRVDSEYMLITAINTSTHLVTVERGVNGTTAAIHLLNADIYTYEPIEDVADECARLAVRRYELRAGLDIVPIGENALELKMGDVQLSNRYRQYYFGSA